MIRNSRDYGLTPNTRMTETVKPDSFRTLWLEWGMEFKVANLPFEHSFEIEVKGSLPARRGGGSLGLGTSESGR